MYNITEVTLFLRLSDCISEYIELSHPKVDQSCYQNQQKYHSEQKQNGHITETGIILCKKCYFKLR